MQNKATAIGTFSLRMRTEGKDGPLMALHFTRLKNKTLVQSLFINFILCIKLMEVGGFIMILRCNLHNKVGLTMGFAHTFFKNRLKRLFQFTNITVFKRTDVDLTFHPTQSLGKAGLSIKLRFMLGKENSNNDNNPLISYELSY
jgi:hypothetical protein